MDLLGSGDEKATIVRGVDTIFEWTPKRSEDTKIASLTNYKPVAAEALGRDSSEILETCLRVSDVIAVELFYSSPGH